MNIETLLKDRGQNQCELCKNTSNLTAYSLPPATAISSENSVLVCDVCRRAIDDSTQNLENHWRCLSESMWSEHLPVQVLTYRLLKRFVQVDWAANLLEQLYLDEDTLKWADAIFQSQDAEDNTPPTKDSNGTILQDGDSVTLIKDLDVKGANFTAKRGTLVKSISLTSNPEHIEGRVNGTQIVLLTCFLKKAV